MRTGWARVVVAFGLGVAMVAFCHPARAQSSKARKPIPDADTQGQALTLLREVYGSEYDAASTPPKRVALAQKLLDQASGTRRKDTVEYYVLLEVARDVATAGGDAPMAASAVKMTAEHFEVDRLQATLDVLVKVARSVRFSDQKKRLAETASELLDDAMVEERLDLAERAADIAMDSAQNARDGVLVQWISARQQELQQRQKAYAPVLEALAVLQVQPTEPAANQTVGIYRCVWQRDWLRGVAMLALGNDPNIKQWAIRELQGPASIAEKTDLADGWWELGKSQQGRYREAFLLRAGDWYRQVQSELGSGSAGLTKMKVDIRLKELASIEKKLGEKVVKSLWEPVPSNNMLTQCYTLGPFSLKFSDTSIVSFIRKARPGQKFSGHTLVSAKAELYGNTARFIGPKDERTKMYYIFHIRTDQNQTVRMQANAPSQYNTVSVLANYRAVPNSCSLPLMQGDHVIIVKQNYNKNASNSSWITLTLDGDHPLKQRQ